MNLDILITAAAAGLDEMTVTGDPSLKQRDDWLIKNRKSTLIALRTAIRALEDARLTDVLAEIEKELWWVDCLPGASK